MKEKKGEELNLMYSAGWITIMEYAGAAAVAHGIVQMVLKVLDVSTKKRWDKKKEKQENMERSDRGEERRGS